MDDNYLLEMQGITKTFPGVKALDAMDFNLKKGEIHCLVGENGAGKSTLMNILSGTYQPDSGAMILDGDRVNFSNPAEAMAQGIIMIHQELDLLPELSVMENVFLGHEIRTKFGAIDWKKQYEEAQKLISSLGCLAATLRVAFCVPIHDKLQPIMNTGMVKGNNNSATTLLRLCFLTTCNSTPIEYG